MADDIEIPDSGVEAEDISPDFGEAEAEAEEFPAEEPQYDYLDVDDGLRQKYVRAKIDGEEVPVPFDELINSYSREAVSTRRFQEAAAMRQENESALRLAQAMQVNPQLTIQYLAQQAGVSVQEFVGMTPAQQEAAVADNDDDEYLDPLELQLRQQQQTLQAIQERFEQRDADDRLAQAVNHLKGTFQIDDDQARAVVGRAIQMNVGPEMFPLIYQSMAYEASQQATAQHTAGQEAEMQRRRQAAAQAQRTVATGSGVPASATTTEVTGNFTSIRDAATAALEGLGIA